MKVSLAKDISTLILECFATDTELLEKWHIEAPASLEICAAKTTKDLLDLKVSVYCIEKHNKVIGYFGKEIVDDNQFLTGFFIKPEYRTKNNIKEFWNKVNTIMGGTSFFCGIYKKNKRAYNFLMKNNGIPFENENSIFFMFNIGMR